MSTYNVIKRFRDAETDDLYVLDSSYESTDTKRVKFLQDKGYLGKNESPDAEFPKHTGGGYYELSNGEKIKGKDEATAAEEDLAKSGE